MNLLQKKKNELAINLLLDAACELIQTQDVSELSFKKVAKQAQISERTMFRYFRTRDEFLDALAKRLHNELNLPPPPDTIHGITHYLTCLYQKFDAQPRKVMVLLSADLFPRVLNNSSEVRFNVFKQLLITAYPKADQAEVIKTAANLRYLISATSWRYYRINYDFDLTTSTECAQLMVLQAIDYLDQKYTS